MTKKKAPRKPPGRPPHQPTPALRRTVKWLAMFRTQEQICEVLGIADRTLQKHYRAELDGTYTEIGVSMMQTGVMRAMGIERIGDAPDPAKMEPGLWKFLMERRFGMIPPAQRLKHSGGIATIAADKLAEMLSPEELRALYGIRSKLAATPGDDPGGDGDSGEEEGEG